MKRAVLAFGVTLVLSACPAEQKQEAGAEAPAKPTGKPTAAELSALVPAQVGHIKNPTHKEMPTPLNMLEFDNKGSKAGFAQVAKEHAAAYGAACKATGGNVVRVATAESRVGYQSYKNGNLPVPGFFQTAGAYAVFGAKPEFKVWIDPLSLNSGDKVRDNKLLKLFFELEDDKNATFTFAGNKIDGALPKGDGTTTVTFTGKLTLHQKSVDFSLPFEVTRKGAALSAKNKNPVELLQLANFNLIAPLKALIASCNHKTMGDAVNLQIELALVEGCK